MDDRITGVMVYYYFVCRRKLWYFCHDINMENENENVMIGRILDETSYKRDDKHVNIDNVINIDFIREHKEIHEIKKSKAIEEAGIWQTKYYLYYLKQRGVTQLKAKIDYPLLRKNIVDLVELDEEYSLVEINAPHDWTGKSVQDLDIRKAFHMNVIGVKDSEDNMSLNIGADYIVKKGDRFLVIGKTTEIERFDYFTE